MIASEIINADIPSLKPTDSGQRALDFMEEYKVLHLPIVFKEQYLGIISESTLLNAYDSFGPISEFKLEFQNVFLSPSDYIFDITQVMVQNKLSILPIINLQESFEGVITLDTLIESYGQLSSVRSPGSTFEVLLKTNDYTLAEVSRIIESNNARILSSFIRTYKDDPTQLILSIKLDTESAQSVFAALERHEYNIVAKFGNKEEQDNDLERLQHLFKYLNT